MPHIVIKPEPGRDLYVIWSTLVDGPIAWGDRAETLVYLTEEWQRNHPALALSDITDPAARLDRADANGTSAAGGYAFFGRWDDTHLMYQQRGLLPRGSLGRLCELLLGDPVDDVAVKALLEPIEGEAEVRG